MKIKRSCNRRLSIRQTLSQWRNKTSKHEMKMEKLLQSKYFYFARPNSTIFFFVREMSVTIIVTSIIVVRCSSSSNDVKRNSFFPLFDIFTFPFTQTSENKNIEMKIFFSLHRLVRFIFHSYLICVEFVVQ